MNRFQELSVAAVCLISSLAVPAVRADVIVIERSFVDLDYVPAFVGRGVFPAGEDITQTDIGRLRTLFDIPAFDEAQFGDLISVDVLFDYQIATALFTTVEPGFTGTTEGLVSVVEKLFVGNRANNDNENLIIDKTFNSYSIQNTCESTDSSGCANSKSDSITRSVSYNFTGTDTDFFLSPVFIGSVFTATLDIASSTAPSFQVRGGLLDPNATGFFANADLRLSYTVGDAIPAPEPTTLALIAIGLAGLGFRRRMH